MKIDILGSEWEIIEHSESEDTRLTDCDGYCDWTARMIIVEREMIGNLQDMEVYIRKVKRHEIVHAYLIECGLSECSVTSDMWACNEEMVDWIARIGPKIYNTWVEADAVLPEDCKSAGSDKRPPAWFEKAFKEDPDKAIEQLIEESRKIEEQSEEKDCPFCGKERKTMVTWIGADVNLKKVEPLPAINLLTGEKEEFTPDPFMALAIETDDGEDYIGIKHCPMCGKLLNVSER